jgi:tartrate-resistant acid phosphatase type 5
MEKKIYINRISLIFLFVFSCQLLSFAQNDIRFAVIGDFGDAGSDEEAVASLVDSWNVDFIITVGDNNYPDGEASTIDENIGQYYHKYIHPYVGSYGEGSEVNRFFPSLGNHDMHTNPPQPYYEYFELPNNERYYDFVWGNIHFFAIDSDSDEPDGVSENSDQGQWLQNALASSSSTWRVVYFHHCPYSSSSKHGSQEFMQWPFKEWGASVVLAGHDHTYERLIIDGFPYFVNGLGGRSIYPFDCPIPGSQVRYNDNYGAMLIEANLDSMTFKFYSIDNDLIDTYTMPCPASDNKSTTKYKFGLQQNRPNPFNSKTKIRFTIAELPQDINNIVSLKVYDESGNEVATLLNENKPAGAYEAEFSLADVSTDLPSGIYYYKLQAGSFLETRKMILLH